MASLREVVSRYKEELRDGIAWLVFWEKGGSWNAEYFYLESSDDTLLPEDKEMLEKVQALDPAAVVLNGYYCGYLAENMSITRLASGVLCHYENGYNNITNFIQLHEHSLQEKKEMVMKTERGGYEIRHTGEKKPMVSEITLKDRTGSYQRRMKVYQKAMNDYQKVRSRPLSAIS